jgi:aerobic-type carbon monoxide dehydrogenase small subunit (CoxS/CutS family)
VVVNNQAVRSCVTPIGDVEGRKVVTIEGLAGGDKLHAIQQAFVDHLAYQCGYCTPGMIMGAYALLLKNPNAAWADIIHELEDHACRCGAHVRIVPAVQAAASAMKGRAR